MKSLQFEGKTFKYDERAPKKYSVQKAIAESMEEPVKIFKALDIIFAGHADEYAEMLDDDMDKMMELFERVSVATGDSKN